MPATRLMPTEEGQDLIDLTREICDKELRPRVDAAERAAATDESFPTDVFRTLGAAGLLSLPHPEEFGGYGQPYEVYLQVVEEIASAWMSVAVGVSVHSLTAYPVTTFGTPQQRADLLPGMLSGEQLGAYCLSEPQSGSDVGSMTTRAVGEGESDGEPTAYRLRGRKAWISHAGHADYYTTFARTSDEGGRGLSCFVVPADASGLSFGAPEKKMGLHCDTVREVMYDDVPVETSRRIGAEGQGMAIALSALDAGRLGIAAAATGLAQSALDLATSYAKERQQFGRPIAANQGLAFLVADMEAAVTSARATYLHAARLKDAGR
ncbi:MAG: acyl-CoA dehydrogenase family protein, partial [Ornithinibacter sp.]